jgi:hypothetical protein
MRLPGAKIHQLRTLGAQPGGFGRDRHGSGNLNAANAIGEYLGSGRHSYYLVRLQPVRESSKLDYRRASAALNVRLPHFGFRPLSIEGGWLKA